MKKKAKTLSKFYTVGYRRPPKKISVQEGTKWQSLGQAQEAIEIHPTSRRSLKANSTRR